MKLILLLTILVTVLICIATFANIITFEHVEITPVEFNELEPNTNDITMKSVILNTAWDIAAAREYEIGIYDCTDFSSDLVKALEEKGIKSYCVFGRYYDDLDSWRYGLHTWVELKIDNETISIEATNGYIISEEEYEHYKKISRGMCV